MWGPIKEVFMSGSRHYVTFVDYFSSNTWIFFLKQISEVFTKLKLWKEEVENQTNRKIKYLWSNNKGTKWTNSNFKRFFEEHDIQRYYSVRKASAQNGAAGRMNRSLIKRTMDLLLNDGLSKCFWAQSVNMSYYLINKSPHVSLEEKISEEIWTSNLIDL